MREGALPSPANQARVIQDVLALAKRENFKVNVIESFDAPWKRVFEGTVGGHWGLLDDASRGFKFKFGEPVSNHPAWIWQAAGGVAFAALIFAAAWTAGSERRKRPALWLAVGVNAIAGGVLFGWAIENVPLESLGVGQWSRSIAMAAVAFVTPILASSPLLCGKSLPALSRVLGTADLRKQDVLAFACGIVLIATLLLAVQIALGLVFDPRYKDFPFAPMTAAIVPLLMLSFAVEAPARARGLAEMAGAVLLALSIVYIVPNETLANWQSLWLCTAFAALALTLFRVRDAQG
jgi:glucan 1,3-beta-glucosidase